MTEVERLRGEIRDLVAGRAAGDVPERKYEKLFAERAVDLVRATVRERLSEGEEVLAEHHVVHAHLRLSESVLREPEQQATSLFLTEQRLLRLRSTVVPGRPVTCDERDGTRIDDVPICAIRRLRTCREVRVGEIATGLVICAVALVAYHWLAITGPLLVLLGLAGVVHALALPTRWVRLEVDAPDPAAEPICIHGMRSRSGRSLLRKLRSGLDNRSVGRAAAPLVMRPARPPAPQLTA
jgi:hypothetical protein